MDQFRGADVRRGHLPLAGNFFDVKVAPTLDKDNLTVFKVDTYTSTSNLKFAEVRLPWCVTRAGAMGQMLAEHRFLDKVSQYHGYDDKCD